MRGRFSIPPHFVFIVIGILIAIYINQKFDCYVLQVSSGAGAGVAANAFGGFVTNDALQSSQQNPAGEARIYTILSATPKTKLDPPSYATAGWPFKYYLDCQFYGSEPLKVFSLTNLFLNLLFFASLIALYLLYERFLGQTSERVAKDGSKTLRRRIGLLDLMLITGIVAGGFGYWRLLGIRTKADVELTREIINAGGIVTRAALVPAPISKFIRRADCENFLRVTTVALSDPKKELLSKVAKIDTLQSLSVSGGDYDLRALDELPQRATLSELRLVGRKLDAGAIAMIASCKSLQYLNLMRTNITADGVKALGDMPRLRELNLIHTDVKLSEFTDPPVAKSLRYISLPHGPAGTSDELLIENWPELEGIECVECDTFRNTKPVVFKVRNCPQLQKITLDVLQDFELTLENLPELKSIVGAAYQIKMRIKETEFTPTIPTLSKIDFKAVPNLGVTNFLADRLQSIQIADAPQLALCFNFPSTNDAMIGGEVEPSTTVSASIRQNWVNDLGKSDGPGKLSFTTMPVSDLDLTPLKQNKSLKAFDLSATDLTDYSQLSGAGIEVLRMPNRPFSAKDIERLARSLPNLKELLFERFTMSDLQLENMPTLKKIFNQQNTMGQFAMPNIRLRLEKIRLVNMPELTEDIDLFPFVSRINIENAPSLTGLSFERPMPAGATVQGLRDLRYFAAGGATMNDAVMQEVLNCKGLQKLTLAYSAVSPEMLQRIGELSSLKYLVLTGSQVNDAVLASWSNTAELKTLALDKTQITSASLPQILSLNNLESLAIDGSLLTDESFAAISKLNRLKSLSIAGATLSRTRMNEIAQMIALKELDLSGCVVTHEAALPVIESVDLRQTLTKLTLNNGKIEDQAFNGFLLGFPELTFELIDCDASPPLIDVLVQSRRAVLEEPNEEQMMFNGMGGMSRASASAPLDEVSAKLFDPNRPAEARPQNVYNSPYSMPPSTSSSFSTFEPVNPLEALGAWIAEAAKSTQRKRKIVD